MSDEDRPQNHFADASSDRREVSIGTVVGRPPVRSLNPRLLPVALCLAGIGGVAAAAVESPRRPNILIAVADDASYPHFSANGCAWVATPAFDRVAREGLRFDRAYTPNAKCGPSRACLLTGRNSWQLGAAANQWAYYPAGRRTFMEALAARGYATGFTGKGWSPGNPGGIDGRPRQLTGPAFQRARLHPPTTGISVVDYTANFEEFLRRRPAGQPFCFWYGGKEPHRAYENGSGARVGGKNPAAIDRVPGPWPDNATVRHDLLDYAFEIEHFDRHLDRMLAILERAGELDNTLVIVTSDNGMPFPRAKGASYDVSHHVPLAVRWGRGIVHPGRNVSGYVSLIDLAPTVLAATGLTAASADMDPMQGRSLLPVLRDEPAAATADHVLLGQERSDIGRPDDAGYPVRGLVRDDFLYLRNFEPVRWPMCDPVTGYLGTDGSPTKTLILAENRQGVNHWRWELNFGRRPAEELYDLRADPDCLSNLASAPAHATRRTTMRDALLAELRAQDDPRLAGRGGEFDRFPYCEETRRDFYNRAILRGEKIEAFWIEASDIERPDFNPEAPAGAPAGSAAK